LQIKNKLCIFVFVISIITTMTLQVYISKKGTKVVAATELHQALQLTDHHYATNVKRWLQDVYEFREGGIRKPEKLRDYGPRKLKGAASLMKDYYLTIELAKLIALSSRSKVKLKYAKWLTRVEDQEEDAESLSHEQVMKVLELTKAMVMVSCQQAAEKSHLKLYEMRNGGNSRNWWKYRAQIMGYSADKLRRKLMSAGKDVRGKSQRQMLMMLDPSEVIRTAIIDLFMGMGKSDLYARRLGDLAKGFAKELELEVYDDRKQQASLFSPNANDRLVNELKAVEQSGSLSVWQ